MVEIKEVKSRKEVRTFISFPLKMYKNNEYFVPPLYMSEKELFKKKNQFTSSCDTVYYLAYRDGKPVGRISGIIQRDANKKWNRKRVRFTRFDSIDDQEVADALFNAVEKWAKDKGMTEFCGPLGFNDMEREGLLVEGFDQLSTFEEQYNADYYEKLVVNHGFKTEVEWIERKVLDVKEADQFEKYKRLTDLMMRKYHLSYIEEKNVPAFIKKHKDEFFKLVDETYSELYGTCPIRKEVEDSLLVGFRLLLRSDNVIGIQDEKGDMVCIGLYFPSIARALQKSGGRLTPPAIVRVLKAIKNPKVLDLGLIGVRADYRNKGVPAMLMVKMAEALQSKKYTHLETNLQLTTNLNILTLFDKFENVIHKRRRSYLKSL